MTMSKGLLALNGLLAVASVFFATEIWKSVMEARPAPGGGSRQAAPVAKHTARPPARPRQRPARRSGATR